MDKSTLKVHQTGSPSAMVYQKPWFFLNGHWETIFPALFRNVPIDFEIIRNRVETPDDDFLDLDWMKQGSQKLILLQHGLEGSSTRPYILGMARQFLRNGYDVCAWNYRGCSGEPNRTRRFYHSGATDDLEYIIDRYTHNYQDITLIGFSLGGNLTLKYLGEKTRPESIKRGIVFSVPLDLASCAENLSSPRAKIYEWRFLKNLKKKVIQKKDEYPDLPGDHGLRSIKTVRDFDDVITGPIHGFKGADDYYRKCSSRYFLQGISVPTLIVNAKNDPLLTPICYDKALTGGLKQIHFEQPDFGGHVGFSQFNKSQVYWSEYRALEFCQKIG